MYLFSWVNCSFYSVHFKCQLTSDPFTNSSKSLFYASRWCVSVTALLFTHSFSKSVTLLVSRGQVSEIKELKSALRSALFRLKVKSGKPRSILVQTATKGNHRTESSGFPKTHIQTLLSLFSCFYFYLQQQLLLVWNLK